MMLRNPVKWRHLVTEYAALRTLEGGMTAQARGQRFNGLIAELFEAFDIPARSDQRSVGELDVTFNHGGRRMILEAKWVQPKASTEPIAKLQRRIEQRMAGVAGVFLSMSGFSPEALEEIDKGRRLDVILLDRLHFEAMLSGFAPPDELLDLVTDAASFRGQAYVPLGKLLASNKNAVEVSFGAPAGLEKPVDAAQSGVSASVVLAGVASSHPGVATDGPDRLLCTTDRGLLTVDLGRSKATWAVPIEGCSGNPVPLPDGSILLARAHGVGRYFQGELAIVAAGSTVPHHSGLFPRPDGSVWCLDPGDAAGEARRPPTVAQLGRELGGESWSEVPLPLQDVHAAVWVDQERLVFCAGHSAAVVSSGLSTVERMVEVGKSGTVMITGVAAERLVLLVEDSAVYALNFSTGVSSVLGHLHNSLRPGVAASALGDRTGYFAVRRLDVADKVEIAVLRLELAVDSHVPLLASPVAKTSRERPESAGAISPAARPSPTPISHPTPSRPLPLGPQTADAARAADYRQGHQDGLVVAIELPLGVFEDLAAAQFDLSRWLVPWHNRWMPTAPGHPGTGVPQWLKAVARYVGAYAAPSHTLEGRFTPSPPYVVGFRDGLSEAWTSAMKRGIVPPYPPYRHTWLSGPLVPGSVIPRHQANLKAVAEAARQQHKRTRLQWIGRVILWLALGFCTLMEIAAIGTTVTGGFKEDPVLSAVIGNGLFGGATGLLLWLAIRDLRRLNQPSRR